MHPKRLEQRIIQETKRAVRDFGLLSAGDRILVAMSGGKDSYGLLWVLQKLQAALPTPFELVPFHLDQGQPGHDIRPIEEHLRQTGLTYEIEYQDTYTRVVEKTEPGKIFCSLCARFRRAILYKAADRHGCNKVALGHHREDLIETLLLNIMFVGQLKSMPPRLRSDDGQHEVIRPLVYVPEDELRQLSVLQNFAIMPCRLCGSQDGQRKYVKGLLADLTKHSRHVPGNILQALGHLYPSHLLDPKHNPLYPRPGSAPPLDDEPALEGRALLRVVGE